MAINSLQTFKKSSLAIVNRINNNYPLSKQIKVRLSKFLTQCASIFRQNNAKSISITGSCGKTFSKNDRNNIEKF